MKEERRGRRAVEGRGVKGKPRERWERETRGRGHEGRRLCWMRKGRGEEADD